MNTLWLLPMEEETEAQRAKVGAEVETGRQLNSGYLKSLGTVVQQLIKN